MSLNEIRLRAKEAQVSNILTEEYSDFHGFVPWDDKQPQLALVPQRHTVENRVVDMSEVQPNAGFSSSTFLNGAVVDFRLDTADISVIDHAFLACNITNSTGGAVSLPPTPFWFDRIEILSPNMSTLATIYDTDLWQSVCMLPKSDFDSLAALMSTTTAYSTAGVSIANNATSELYLPLITLLNAARLHLPGITGAMTFRFRSKSSTYTLISGTHPTFTKVVMLLSGFDEPQSKRSARTAFYKGLVPRFQNTPMYFPFYAWDHFTQTQTLTASVKSDIKLSGLQGMFSAIFIIIRASPLTAANQGTFLAIDTLAVADESGAIFCGNHTKSHARSRIIAASQLQNQAALSSNFYMIPFSSAVVNDFVTGQVHGYQVFKGNEVLSITPGSTFASGSCQIDVLALRGNALRVLKGIVEKRQ
jgi:hypothetical protein